MTRSRHSRSALTARRWLTLALVAGLMLPLATTASSRDPGKVIAGWVEKISIGEPERVVKAKLDTGAKTSSIHATHIEQFKRDGKRWMRFHLQLRDNDGKLHSIPMERPKARRVAIKNTDGDHDRRAVVELEFCFDGRRHVSEFTLADRTEYIYDVLLGREFLAGVAVVDSEETFLTLAGCPAPAP